MSTKETAGAWTAVLEAHFGCVRGAPNAECKSTAVIVLLCAAPAG